jgi:hypothetical protein
VLWSGIRTEDRDGTGVLALRSDETAARTSPGHAAFDAADGATLDARERGHAEATERVPTQRRRMQGTITERIGETRSNQGANQRHHK